MKILYDISVLGLAHYEPRCRTGIFRVVENLVYGLASSKECDLTFCASTSFRELMACLDYLEARSELQKISLPKPPMAKNIFDSNIFRISSKIHDTSGLHKLLLIISRKLLSYPSKIIAHYFDLIDPSSLAEANIFHSPFHPIPAKVKNYKETKVFLTIYDLIPVLYPKFFKSDQVNLFQKTLDSLDIEENWVICISQATKNDLCNHLKIDPSRVFVTHLAASDLFYQCLNYKTIAATKKKYNIPPDAQYILSLSTLEPRKNIDTAIKCFAELVQQENIKDLYLVLVGIKGWHYDQIFEEIYKYSDLRNRIIITGYLADEDLAAIYSGALAFVYPSLYEGFGLPPLEAMKCGVPVITSNTSSLPEVVGDAGIMVDPKDADALCQSMLEIYKKPSLRESMSLKSLERSKQFSWEKCTQETITAYKAALRI